ncbi:hydroxyisourate hydrolase [uncultured Jannaschia sp.]|uniref:hydroxyisourate hydrolase n=1 Tax=uncultured Jannaschia sp. TaxID=293347 RepID=UPI002612E580|nr:hydroxyisourate hydrolase [uncultured Jannaschia sp.]
MIRTTLLVALLGATFTAPAMAEGISTHVLNIATGHGGQDIPVTLDVREGDAWVEIGRGVTGANGRVEGFGIETEDADYRLTFKLSDYAALGGEPLFPEISIVFDVSDMDRHHHVPVLVSPFGYSTYLGN